LAGAKFYKAFNAIFGKTGRVAPESVIMKLVSSKCLPLLLYATEACPFSWRDQSSINILSDDSFCVLMKNFNTRSRDISEQCQLMFGMLPVADQVFMRKVRFLVRFRHSENLICSLFVSSASNEIAFICNKYSANEICTY